LAKVAGEEKRRRPKEWIRRFATMKRLKHRIAERLVDAGVLKEEEDRVLLLFNRTVYPEADPRPEEEITRRIRKAVIGSTTQVDPRTVVLIALAKHTDLLRHAVERNLLKEHKKHIEKLIKGQMAGQATKEAVEAMQAALMVAVFVPAITSTTTG
jgi:hypothetical protein